MARLIILAAVFAIGYAHPVWIENSYVPSVFFRTGRSPSVAFGFGSGFSSNIGGISHSTGISSSFQTGDAQAYGAGIGGTNGNVFAKGVGYANAAPSYTYHQQPTTFYTVPARSWTYYPTSAASSAHNFGGYGSTVSTAQSNGGYGSATAAVHGGLGRTQTAVSTAHNVGGYGSAVSSASNGLGSAVSSAQNAGNFRSAVSAVQGHNGYGNHGTAVSAAQDFGGYRASTAQTSQQRGLGFQNSGATSINGPGIQAAQSHAVNTF